MNINYRKKFVKVWRGVVLRETIISFWKSDSSQISYKEDTSQEVALAIAKIVDVLSLSIIVFILVGDDVGFTPARRPLPLSPASRLLVLLM